MSRNSANGAGLEYGEMGDRLREARQARGLSLRGLAERLGVSPSLISQVETGRAKPSVSTLYAIVTELGISLDELVYPDARRPSPVPEPAAAAELSGSTMPAGPVQRAKGRKSIRLASGVIWERLTTASLPNVDFLYVTYEVGGASSPEHEFQRHGGEEWGYVLSGMLGVKIGLRRVRARSGRCGSVRFGASASPVQCRGRPGARDLVRARPWAGRQAPGIDRGRCQPEPTLGSALLDRCVLPLHTRDARHNRRGGRPWRITSGALTGIGSRHPQPSSPSRTASPARSSSVRSRAPSTPRSRSAPSRPAAGSVATSIRSRSPCTSSTANCCSRSMAPSIACTRATSRWSRSVCSTRSATRGTSRSAGCR